MLTPAGNEPTPVPLDASIYVAGHRGLDRLAPRLTHYEAAPNPLRLAGVLAAGLRG